ncbi:Cytoskeleton protein RodZ [Candidatus Bealeia paramacronuclearis]|uniref:Cytoskeleton protein RodZ n=1 Tax=Candidatus Bealeia paramacronuclearis TaxID=1921001 RepID=A0ABZ2C352_9PROT|nr:Cytoskeleton protein RodZ [Candidatus Bealeia paramacronuclearis]
MAKKQKDNFEENLNLTLDEAAHSGTVGDILKDARIIKGFSLEDVSKALCITKSFLVRLETQCETLPIDVYTLGFIRAYARFLDLNSDVLVGQFKASASIPQNDETLVFPKPLPRRGIPHVKVVSISLAFALMMFLGWETITRMSPLETPSLDVKKLSLAENSMPMAPHSMDENGVIKVADIEAPVSTEVFVGTPLQQNENPATNPPHETNTALVTSPDASNELITPSAPETTLKKVSFESEPPASAPQGHAVTMNFTEKTWVQVKDLQGQIVINRTFNPGEKYEFKNSEGYILKTGNAGGIRLIVNDNDLGPIGNTGEVVGNISLTPEKLLAQHPKTQ